MDTWTEEHARLMTAARLRTPAAASGVVASTAAATGVLSMGYAVLNAVA